MPRCRASSRNTGIPYTKSGREIGSMVTGGGCLMPGLLLAIVACLAIFGPAG